MKRTFLIDHETSQVSKVVDGDVSDTEFAASLIRVKTKASLKKLGPTAMTAIYNALSDKPRKTAFKDKDKGADATWEALQAAYPPEVKEGSKGKGRKKTDGLIVAAQDEHTKRGTAKNIFDAIYKAGTEGILLSVLQEKFAKKGVKPGYVSLCVRDGVTQEWVTFEEVEVVEE